MKTKEKILEILESNRGKYFSGEELAGKLELSRTAVWKAVKTLQEDGYSIHAVTNRGYCLSDDTDILSPQGIRKYLMVPAEDVNVEVFSSVASTNTLVYQRAGEGEREGYIAVANAQTSGRGRYGRSFYSPAGGVYLSVLLRPKHYAAQDAGKLTAMAAVAMCEAIESVSDFRPKIKWVNDIYVNGKKVCGILTEGSFGMESGLLEYAVLGAGVNVFAPEGGFPAELENIAGAIFDFPQKDIKNRLTAAFINFFMGYYRGQNTKDYMEKYRAYSLVIGKKVTVISGKSQCGALVKGIDEEGRLMVQYDSGEQALLNCGEISLKI